MLRILMLVALLVTSSSCRLFDDPNAVVLTEAADMDIRDTPSSSDLPTDLTSGDTATVADVDQSSDAASDASDVDASDVGEPLVVDPFTLLELIRNEVCAYYARQDYHGTVFFGVGFRTEEGCRDFFDLFLRNVLGVLARDVHFDRARINEDAIRELVDHVRNYNGDPRVFPITNVDGIVTPLSAIGDACSSNFACVSSPFIPAVCYLPTPDACDGVCVEASKVCNGALCGTDEWCFQGSCRALLADGQSCSNDIACANRCLSGVCGSLALGDDCADNPDDCGAGAFCRSSAPRICQAIGILNDPCIEDAGCVVGHYCDETTSLCAGVADGTPCRLGACAPGLNCVQTSDVDTERRCYEPRPIGEYCSADSHCAAGTYCNVNTCTAAKTPPQLCVDDRECDSICRYQTQGDANGECAQFVWGLPEGATCHETAAVCGMPFECEPSSAVLLTGICRAPVQPQIDDSCEPSRPFWCPDGSTCRGNICVAIAPAGAACSVNEECESNLCVMNRCYDRVSECTQGLMP